MTATVQSRFSFALVSLVDHTCFQSVKKGIKILCAEYLVVDNTFLWRRTPCAKIELQAISVECRMQ
jgi:hypothetical protein